MDITSVDYSCTHRDPETDKQCPNTLHDDVASASLVDEQAQAEWEVGVLHEGRLAGWTGGPGYLRCPEHPLP
jgi:hypothetical protein